MHTVLLVLGDIGRSPRMEFHAIELSKQCPVSVVCYEETAPLATIQDNKEITLFGLRVMSPLKAIPFRTVVYLLFYAPLKFAFLSIQLLYVFPNYSHIVIQNPPALPSFLIAAIVKILTGCSVVVDWHNTAYSIVMNVHNLKETSFIIRLLKFYELFIPLIFDYHFTVTKAMKDFLIDYHFSSKRITVLYDKPFINLTSTPSQRNELLIRLRSTFPDITKPFIDELVENNTNIVCGVSSTSWTPDEDFGVLFEALKNYEKKHRRFTKIGPLKSYYEELLKKENMKRVCVIPVWLEHEDYPKLLAACQFGISLHQSSSKLDLPMKVLDMFGCALPVLARGYPTIRDELVEENKVGFCFDTAEELNDLLVKNLSNSKQREKFLEEMKQNVINNNTLTWSKNWQEQSSFPQSTPPQFESQIEELSFFKESRSKYKTKVSEYENVMEGLLKQVDTMRKAKHETDYLIDENTKLKKQVTELQTELETTKQNWMDDVTQRLNEIHELKSMNSKLQTSLGVLIKENETKQQLTTMVDKLEGVYKGFIDYTNAVKDGFKDNDVTIQPMDLSVSDIPVKDDKLESFECPFVGNTYYSPSINLEDDEDHIKVSDINTESVLIKQKKWRDPITIQKKQKGILKPRLPITLKPLSPPKPRIALSGINDKSKNKIAEIIKRKGGIYCESIDENITHLIAHKKVTKSCIIAMLRNVWIVPIEWLKAKPSSFPNENEFTKKPNHQLKGKKMFFSEMFESNEINVDIKDCFIAEAGIVITSIEECDIAILEENENFPIEYLDKTYTFTNFVRSLPFPDFVCLSVISILML
ncbi:chitobiosyldiphosphodolichol beta-mannosyltransferase isoform X1 [Entamoeba marina]